MFTFVQILAKMKHSLLYLPLLAIALFAFQTGCNKYPDGPGASFRSATSRISTTWDIKAANQDGVDITDQFEGEFFEFEEDGSFRRLETDFLISLPPFSQDTIVNIVAEGEWTFIEDETQVELFYTYTFRDPYNSSILYNEEVNERWEIRRLTQDELWLRQEGTTIRFEFFNE
ncbi:MAG: hypothetical protein D6722_13185 [Bacteroidetes bacterium]|nr:MAG: hypothetical protein D6722_13185 [Bacteroidota bacterium]